MRSDYIIEVQCVPAQELALASTEEKGNGHKKLALNKVVQMEAHVSAYVSLGLQGFLAISASHLFFLTPYSPTLHKSLV